MAVQGLGRKPISSTIIACLWEEGWRDPIYRQLRSWSCTDHTYFPSGKGNLVVLWSTQDHISSLAADPGSGKSPGSGGAGSKSTSKVGPSDRPVDSPTVGPGGTYQGHEDTIENVQFCPSW